MWIGEAVDISVTRNSVTPLGFQLWDEVANQPLNITGYSFLCSVYSFDGSTKIVDHNVEIVGFTEGEYNITFDGRLYDVEGAQELAKCCYQILANDGSGPVEVQRGVIFLLPGGAQ